MEPAAGGQPPRRRHVSPGLLALLCSSSLLLNAVFIAHHLFWALQAARAAEAVAATDCSGHGRVFLDGVAGEDGRPGCECNTCFSGPDCSLRTPNCTADADRCA
ncbi:hypothetical protein PR202_gb04971 [Eleusine coracana subsp. coracana]|uniref:Alliinase EGF-like domain-containing protein n=1 Tax=Eleusine coracana subsp. coracana TaxID=191504 RepID=A0AAV5E547_ELECO|nr:hypothetical protein PR202_gb04971 [Eleusine coracana subsp. coracana]